MAKQQTVNEITYTYVKPSDFRTIGASGVFGGFTSNGHLNMNFYIETAVVPHEVKHSILPNGTLGPEILRSNDASIKTPRELIIGVNIDLNVAKVLRDWMTTHIEMYEKSLADAISNLNKGDQTNADTSSK